MGQARASTAISTAARGQQIRPTVMFIYFKRLIRLDVSQRLPPIFWTSA